ncbi:hypothetical protein SEPL_244 [Salmonella phage SE_PL]|nr:hypothetical protein CPT_Munch_181 [Salmonella phage Munch]EAZ2022971.1 hypothetical protein [Salmonella enterica]ECV9084105.1 hypothetical protein [Salmonella enterica subsp. enterica serovar Infantis]MCP0435794.1 hypothetical protein [Salmonella enterica subsp. enterica serovar Mbandaka]QCW18864.1 hypothetical protein 7t3_0343 [Salmonella phage 7t3]QIG62857.1 hypothetical protein SEPL_244 [Salmonella phage SE_PL]
MQRVNELIEAIMEIYFEEVDTVKRYMILSELEKSIKEARSVTIEQIESLEHFRDIVDNKVPLEMPQLPDDYFLEKMSEVVSKVGGNRVLLSKTFKIGDLTELENIDSLDVVEIILEFEEILGIDIDLEIDDDTTLGDLLNLR